jgi:hypothetical protein
MKPESGKAWLPESTLIYREYEALMDDAKATVAITLSSTWENGAAVDEACTDDVVLCGHILVVDFAGNRSPPMIWTFDGADISIVASSTETLPADLRAAIGAFLQHFIREIDKEIDAALGGVSTTVH